MSSSVSRPSDGTSRRALCEEHQVWYNVLTSAGCPTCLADAAKRGPEEKPLPVSPFRVAGFIAAGIVVYFGGMDAIEALADQGSVVYEETRRTAGKLNPNAFRAELEALERAVFDPGNQPGQASLVTQAAFDLREAIENPPSAGLISQSRMPHVTQTLVAFGASVSDRADVGYGSYDPSFAQDEWLAIRADLFVNANWFRTPDTTVALARAANRTASTAGSRAIIDLRRDLENLLRFARSEMRRVGEPVEPRGSWESRQVVSAWDEVRLAISTQLRIINASLPSGEVGLTANELQTHQLLSMSAQEIDALTRLTSVPSRDARAQRLNLAQSYLDQAVATN